MDSEQRMLRIAVISAGILSRADLPEHVVVNEASRINYLIEDQELSRTSEPHDKLLNKS